MISEDDWDPSSSTARHTSVSECASLATSVADGVQCGKKKKSLTSSQNHFSDRFPVAAVGCQLESLEKVSCSVTFHVT